MHVIEDFIESQNLMKDVLNDAGLWGHGVNDFDEGKEMMVCK